MYFMLWNKTRNYLNRSYFRNLTENNSEKSKTDFWVLEIKTSNISAVVISSVRVKCCTSGSAAFTDNTTVWIQIQDVVCSRLQTESRKSAGP